MNGDLTSALEAAMMKELHALDASGLTGKDAEQGPLWPPKERVNLIEVVAKYVIEKKAGTPPELGKALGQRGE